MGNILIFFSYLYISLFLTSEAVKRLQYANINQDYQGSLEIIDSVKWTRASTLIGCTRDCMMHAKCISYFYNRKSKRCVMHSKEFVFTTITYVADKNWNYYVTRDASGRCPPTYLYYRYFDFCYFIGTIEEVNVMIIKNMCMDTGGRLAAIDSREKEDYFRHILANRPYIRVIVAGNRTGIYEWTLDDGSKLTYFNWYPGQPNTANDPCLVMFINEQLFDRSCEFLHPATFVCEYT